VGGAGVGPLGLLLVMCLVAAAAAVRGSSGGLH
jgi:hypothetical protein